MMKTRKSFIRTSLALTGVTLSNSILGMTAQLMIARAFGAGVLIDSYFTGLSIPVLVGGVLIAAIGYQIVPFLVHLEHEGREPIEMRSALLAVGMKGAAIIAVAGMVLSIALMHAFPNSEVYLANRAIPISIAGWCGMWFTIQTALLTAISHINGHFVIPAAANCIPNIGSIIICGIILAVGGSPFDMAVTVAAGQAVAYFVLRKYTMPKPVKYSERDRQMATDQIRGLPVVILSMTVFTLYSASDAFWGSMLHEGVVTTLGYGQRLVVSVAGLGVSGASTIMLPEFSKLAAQGNRRELLKQLVRTIRAIALITTPIAICVCIFAYPTIHLLFEGERFNPTATAGLAHLIPYLFVGMVPMSCSTVIYRALYAVKDKVGAAGIGIMGSLIYVAMSALTAIKGFPLGTFGIGYIITWIAVAAVGILRVSRGEDRVECGIYNRVWFVRFCVVCVCALAVAYSIATILRPISMAQNKAIDAVALGFGYLGVCLVFAGAAMIIKLKEAAVFVREVLPPQMAARLLEISRPGLLKEV